MLSAPTRKDVMITLIVHIITNIFAIALPIILEYHPAPGGLSRFWPILVVVATGMTLVGTTLERLVRTMPPQGISEETTVPPRR
jgi:hypothetical protein